MIGFTIAQITAIIMLLQAFGVSSTTIAIVQNDLQPQSTTTQEIVPADETATTTATSTIVIQSPSLSAPQTTCQGSACITFGGAAPTGSVAPSHPNFVPNKYCLVHPDGSLYDCVVDDASDPAFAQRVPMPWSN